VDLHVYLYPFLHVGIYQTYINAASDEMMGYHYASTTSAKWDSMTHLTKTCLNLLFPQAMTNTCIGAMWTDKEVHNAIGTNHCSDLNCQFLQQKQCRHNLHKTAQ